MVKRFDGMLVFDPLELTPVHPCLNLCAASMSSFEISLLALGCFIAGVALGMWLQNLLPGHHLSKESQDTVKLGAGMVATMSALVLGLLVSSAKTSFDAVNLSIAQTGVKVIQLDQLLSQYGPETAELRVLLRQSVAGRIEAIWSRPVQAPAGLRAVEKSAVVTDFQHRLLGLSPKNDLQKLLLAQAQQVSADLGQSRLILIEQQQSSLPTVFLGLLVFWLTLLFLSFGLFAPRNFTVLAVLFVCAFSVSSAIFLILEMSHPLDGFIKVSSAPLVKALEMMGR